MKRLMLCAYCVWIVGLRYWPNPVLAADLPRDVASDVRAVFKARCAGCHGPDLAKPRGRFGYVLDLARVASNPEIVVPSFPTESELWELVRRGEMPPDDSPTGPLSQKEKEVIHTWIAAGAPAGPYLSAEQNVSDSAPVASAPTVEKSMLRTLGPFHLVAVHFPIALLIAAAVAEFGSGHHRRRVPSNTVHFCVVFGAAGAVVAAALGWIPAGNGHGAGAPYILRMHRWIGAAAVAWAVVTAILLEREERRGVRSLWFRAWLIIGALLIAVEGHFGGMLVHGDDFLSSG